MRALCGAIITAGAVIGLGLTALGIGTRYTREGAYDPGGEVKEHLVRLSQMDRPLVFILVFLTCVAVIGLGVTFLGLAYHHHRREREHQLERERHGQPHRTSV
jgi:multisubunit Na+/H+ antiporter MnhC subunit